MSARTADPMTQLAVGPVAVRRWGAAADRARREVTRELRGVGAAEERLGLPARWARREPVPVGQELAAGAAE